jgi:predicted extracellular nuclease
LPVCGQDQDIVPIGQVQGAVADTDRGTGHRSPLVPRVRRGAAAEGEETTADATADAANGDTGAAGGAAGDAAGAGTAAATTGAASRPRRASVTVQGVIYQKTLSLSDRGAQVRGFFVQNTAATADRDPNTSDGLWVFQGGFPTLLPADRADRTRYTPTVGDEVVLRGEVSEYFGQTQLSRAALVRVVRRGVDLDQALPPFEAAPPDDLEASNRYWERREGMRGRLPAGSLVLSARHLYAGDAEAWVVRGDHPLAKRTAPYSRRAFRDTHPLDNDPAQGFDDENGYRFALGSQGLKGQADSLAPTIAPLRTFDTITSAATGGVLYSFGKYAIQVEAPVTFTRGADPSLNAPPIAPDRTREYSVATYNIENLYDFRDDPSDGCDFKGNTGCQGVAPPFDYAPASEAEYQAHLRTLASNITRDLHAPDVILVVEAEDQDICRIENGAMDCGTGDEAQARAKADGRPDTLQDLALAIQGAGGPAYQAAYDRDGADTRGITCAFLFRTDRVEMPVASPTDPLLGSAPRVAGFEAGLSFNRESSNPKVLNAPLKNTVASEDAADTDNENQGARVPGIFTRAPQVGLFRIFPEKVGQGQPVVLYAIANHFSSRPNQRLTQRRAQARYLAALVATLQAADPGARVVAGGDLNVYPRPDDPFGPRERKKPSDQLAALYDQGLINLWDSLVQEAPEAAYTYVFNGQAQTLDHLWNTPAQHAALVQVRVAHINADWPEGEEGGEGGEAAGTPGSPARRGSDHDPVVARYRFGAR